MQGPPNGTIHLELPACSWMPHFAQNFCSHIAQLIRTLQAQEENLFQEQFLFFQAQTAVQKLNLDTAEISCLDIGGTPFHTTQSTMNADTGSLLAALSSGNYIKEDEEDGYIFLDRDPLMFQHVLAYLRSDGKFLPLPAKTSDRMRLLRETEFYNLIKLGQHLRARASCSILFDLVGHGVIAERIGDRQVITCPFGDHNAHCATSTHCQWETGQHDWYIKLKTECRGLNIGIVTNEYGSKGQFRYPQTLLRKGGLNAQISSSLC
eukprot:TRINITY_DN661_c0_g1_i2.p1 TRINITY_DN661_c0_g1~~TRINITY_DN661_c0_g1_i2.p1  ORF type:complete len:271 (-),score=36.16 TRINITY_DN661_c0_g1_i2:271-1062(-)